MTIHPTPPAELTNLARDIVAVFDGGLTHIATIRASTAELAAEVDALLAVALSGQPGDDAGESLFQQFLRRAAGVAESADAATALLCGDELRATVQLLSSNLAELGKRSTELRMISSLTKIASTEREGMDSRLGAFVETLDTRSEDFRRIATRSAESVSMIWSASGRAGEGLRAMSAAFRAMRASTISEAELLVALEAAHRRHVADVQDGSRRLADNVRNSVGRPIDCLQFPDAFAQRAEHVGAMLSALGEDRSNAEREAIAALAHAQMLAMADALDRVTRDAEDALTAVLRAAGGDLASEREPGQNPSLAYLEAAIRANSTMLAAADAARTRLDAALDQVGDVQTRIDAAIAALEASSEMNNHLEYAAHNAAITASRLGSSTSPLSVLAASVKTAVTQTSDLTGTLSLGLQRFREASRQLDQAGLAGELAALAAIQEHARAQNERQSDGINVFERSQDAISSKAATIARAAEAAVAAFTAAGGHSAPLRRFAETVAASRAVPTDLPQGVDLGWIEALYTMEDERAVHRQLFPGEEAATPAEEDLGEARDDFML